MPNQPTHDALVGIGALTLTGLSYLLGADPVSALLAGSAHLFSGYMCSPDTDLRQSRPYGRWGLFASIVWWPFGLNACRPGLREKRGIFREDKPSLARP